MVVVGDLKKTTRKDLWNRVQIALERIGIDDVVMREWDPRTIDTQGTHGVARERRHDNGANVYRMDERIDIGYFERHSFDDDYTIGSFMINPLAFTPERQEELVKQLLILGVRPGDYIPGGMIFGDPERNKKLDEREKTAMYQ